MTRCLVTIGLVLVIVGLLWPWLTKLGLGRLPGDIVIERENVHIYFPDCNVHYRQCCPVLHPVADEPLTCISHSRWLIGGEMARCAVSESRVVVDTKGEYRRTHRDSVER